MKVRENKDWGAEEIRAAFQSLCIFFSSVWPFGFSVETVLLEP